MLEKVGNIAYLTNRRRKTSRKRRRTATTTKRRRSYAKVTTRRKRRVRRNPIVEYRKGGRKIRRKISMSTLRAKVKRRRRRARRNPVEGEVNRRRRRSRVVIVNRRRKRRTYRNPVEGTVNRRRRRRRSYAKAYTPRRRRRRTYRNPVEGEVNRRRRRYRKQAMVNRRRKYRRNPLLRQTPNRREQVWRILANGLGMGLGLTPILLRNQVYKWLKTDATTWWGHLLANYVPSLVMFGAGYGLNYASKNGNEFSLGLMMGSAGSLIFNALDHIIGMVNDSKGNMPMLASKVGTTFSGGESLLLGSNRLLGSEYNLLGAPVLRGPVLRGEDMYGAPVLRGEDMYGEDMYGPSFALAGDDGLGDLNAYMLGNEFGDYDGFGEDLYGEDLYGEDLYGEDLYGEDLYGEDLYGEDMYGAPVLRGEDMYGEDMYGASALRGDDMGSDLLLGRRRRRGFGSEIYGEDMYGEDMYGEDMYGEDLFGEDTGLGNMMAFNGLNSLGELGVTPLGGRKYIHPLRRNELKENVRGSIAGALNSSLDGEDY